MPGSLATKVAVITGAASGIGQAIAERFAAEGARIAVADVAPATETEQKVKALGAGFLGVRCDVSRPDQVEDFARQVRAAFGQVDILVNNAAIQDMIPFERLSYEDWTRFIGVNVNSHFLTVRAFLDDLKASSGGRVIGLASTVVWSKVADFVHYTTTKAAVMGFTNALATELGQYGITVNAIAPSLVRTPTTSSRDGAEDTFSLLASLQDIHRVQTPEDVTGAAVFLASDAAKFITGQTIAVDGGLTRR